jgi:GNAT acetyltransferase
LNDLALTEHRASLLFLHGERGRITGTNEPPPPGSAPRLWVGRTDSGTVWRFRNDLPDDVAVELERILSEEQASTDFQQPLKTRDRILTEIGRNSPIESTCDGPSWRFPDSVSQQADVVPITQANAHLVPTDFAMLAGEIQERQPFFGIVRDNVAVSICYSARNSDLAAEAGVDTLEAYRGRGFAVAVTASWADAVRNEGREPLYSTSWENAASRRVADKLGLILYGADFQVS